MIRESVTIDEAITLLNEALSYDPVGVTALLDLSATTNGKMLEHPSIQCDEANGFSIHPFGFFIGCLFGFTDRTPIAYVKENGVIVKFQRTPND